MASTYGQALRNCVAFFNTDLIAALALFALADTLATANFIFSILATAA
jgi:hypothetical protein